MIDIENTDALISALLDLTASQVLETMFFMTVLGPGPKRDRDKLPRLRSHLSFSGDPSGEFEVEINQGLGVSLAAAFLGEDESEITPQQVEDVAGEFANMVCGSALSSLGIVESFKLKKPVVTTLPVGTPMIAGVHRNFLLDSGTLRMALLVNFDRR